MLHSADFELIFVLLNYKTLNLLIFTDKMNEASILCIFLNFDCSLSSYCETIFFRSLNLDQIYAFNRYLCFSYAAKLRSKQVHRGLLYPLSCYRNVHFHEPIHCRHVQPVSWLCPCEFVFDSCRMKTQSRCRYFIKYNY